ncbi:SDR family oxidoreductase [Spirillospora sp. NPDC048911]|uniref:SDR family oxidoreductase n=1 Tax=Spirillospora sp. NPDC048911 TaxID=3364527 RepID=UPI003710EBD2
MTILLTGGTGTLGKLVTPLLADAGSKVRVLSRSSHEAKDGIEYVNGDLATGEGLEAALSGIETIIHCAGSAKGDEDKARNLVEAAAQAGSPHVVYISVVGADRLPVESVIDRTMFGYFAAKRAAELAVSESGLPWTTLRATQFHDFVLAAARGMAKMPVIPVPAGVRFQPVDARDVAARLVELALGEPSGLVPDIAGPKVYGMDEVVRGYLAAVGKRRPMMPVRLPGKAARAYREGANLSLAPATGQRTWEDFLAEQVSQAR